MILTVTLNPSVDISYRIQDFKPYAVNRSAHTLKTAGGKGLNVSRVLKILDADVKATGFLGGELGKFIEKNLAEEGVKNDFLFIDEPTRNCIAIISKEGQTEVLESGPKVSPKEQEAFLEKYEKLCAEADVVAISGSAPVGVDTEFVEKLIEIGNSNKAMVIADMSGKNLENIVKKFKEKPFAIKPNLEEFAALTGEKDISFEDIPEALLKNTEGIECVMLTCGKDGAFVKYGSRVFKVEIPQIEAVNPIGSGDSTVAGFCSALDNNQSIESAIILANACGMSNCMNEKTGHIEMEEVEELRRKIRIKELGRM